LIHAYDDDNNNDDDEEEEWHYSPDRQKPMLIWLHESVFY
jgi:hypothetical protein